MAGFESVVQAISTLGFPIACCLICFWYINKREEAHKDERGEMLKVIENNTNAMVKLSAQLEGVLYNGKHTEN